MTKKKTKIVCTLGPACDDEAILEQLMKAGMDVARFNFSHGTHAEHKARFERFARVRDRLGLPVASLLDTKGPEIRLMQIEGGKVELQANQQFILTTEEVPGSNQKASITYKDLPRDVRPGTHILIDDGLIDMEVERVEGCEIFCRVLNGGFISTKKGINVPDTSLSMPFISEQDRKDILFGIATGFEFIAASFTRSAADIYDLRQLLHEHGGDRIKVIAKIENAEGIQNIEEIIRAADGVMVARGDMGVEIPMAKIPGLQKKLIQLTRDAGKPVITATQMLDSMIKNPRPTRAEATDVANAIYDGTSAIMLSGETAAGAYPVEAVKTMAAIALQTEEDIDYTALFRKRIPEPSPNVTNAISHATVTTAMDLKARGIVTVTIFGATARAISKYRPSCPIIACSPHMSTVRQMNLSWGVIPVLIQQQTSTDALFANAYDEAVRHGLLRKGDLVVTTAGVPLGISGATNLLQVDIIGEQI
ncbi:MAG: pyruvate kinase [Oscillospiraceae bacterium]|nr:pyruvate kinase [Oscillospiraceae bacterium]